MSLIHITSPLLSSQLFPGTLPPPSDAFTPSLRRSPLAPPSPPPSKSLHPNPNPLLLTIPIFCFLGHRNHHGYGDAQIRSASLCCMESRPILPPPRQGDRASGSVFTFDSNSEQPNEECQEHSEDHKGDEDVCCFKATKFKYNQRVASSRRDPTPNNPTQQNNLPTTSPPSFMEKFRKNFKQKHPTNKYVVVRMEVREK